MLHRNNLLGGVVELLGREEGREAAPAQGAAGRLGVARQLLDPEDPAEQRSSALGWRLGLVPERLARDEEDVDDATGGRRRRVGPRRLLPAERVACEGEPGGFGYHTGKPHHTNQATTPRCGNQPHLDPAAAETSVEWR
jgi:hypothetical protein